MAKHQSEVMLSVSDYQGDFEACSKDIEAAREEFLILASAEEIVLESIESITFLEFDSSNPSHATAYFLVTYEADKDVWHQIS